ncbi:MAG: N-acetyltransferase family protein [Gemmatimonadales bacterium]
MPATIRMLGQGDETILTRVAPDVFDHPVDPGRTGEFLRDPRHHLAVALDDDLVVGFASAVDYVHPDKQPELWINEVGVAPDYRRQGIGAALLRAVLEAGRARGCRQAWVLTSPGNAAAVDLYRSVGGEPSPEPAILLEFPL